MSEEKEAKTQPMGGQTGEENLNGNDNAASTKSGSEDDE